MFYKLTILFLLTITMVANSADYFELRDGLKNSRQVFEQTQGGVAATKRSYPQMNADKRR